MRMIPEIILASRVTESVQGVYIDPSREDAYLQPQVRGTRSCLGTCVLRDRGGGHQQDGYRREALHQIRKNREGESPIIFGWRGPRLVWVKGAFFGDSIGNKALQIQLTSFILQQFHPINYQGGRGLVFPKTVDQKPLTIGAHVIRECHPIR